MPEVRRDDIRIERNGEIDSRIETDHVRETTTDGRGVLVDEHVVDERSVRYTEFSAATVNGVLGIFLIALEGLLATRFLLIAFGASTSSGFVRFILDLSHPFMRPFEGAFANRVWDEGVIEPATLLAMGVYVLLAALIMMLVNTLMPKFAERRGVDRHHATRI